MRILPANRRSRRIVKTAIAASVAAAAAAGTLFATGAGAAVVQYKTIQVYLPAGVKCFSLQVNDDDPYMFGPYDKPDAHVGPGGTREFTYLHFNPDEVKSKGGEWWYTGIEADVGATVDVTINYQNCGRLALTGPNHITEWTVPSDSFNHAWIDTTKVEGP
jgi:hypothetical protein